MAWTAAWRHWRTWSDPTPRARGDCLGISCTSASANENPVVHLSKITGQNKPLRRVIQTAPLWQDVTSMYNSYWFNWSILIQPIISLINTNHIQWIYMNLYESTDLSAEPNSLRLGGSSFWTWLGRKMEKTRVTWCNDVQWCATCYVATYWEPDMETDATFDNFLKGLRHTETSRMQT